MEKTNLEIIKMYEDMETNFHPFFLTHRSYRKEYNYKSFVVLKRYKDEDGNLALFENKPAWYIKFSNGERFFATADEIVSDEINRWDVA